MNFEIFSEKVRAAGYLPVQCKQHSHWQIQSAHYVLNYWPWTAHGPKMHGQFMEQSRTGGEASVEKALQWVAQVERRYPASSRVPTPAATEETLAVSPAPTAPTVATEPAVPIDKHGYCDVTLHVRTCRHCDGWGRTWPWWRFWAAVPCKHCEQTGYRLLVEVDD